MTRSYYRSQKLVIVGFDFFTQGGAWRSIYAYFKNQESLGFSVHMIDMRGKRAIRQFIAASLFSPRILINGMGSFNSWMVLFLCIFRKDVFIYLHETGYSLEAFSKGNGLRYGIFKALLKRNGILCVSKQAEALYRNRFGACKTHVVYECPGAENSMIFDKTKKHICMVGSMDERKGVDLFSRVADLAAESRPDWQFHWIGGLATKSPLYRSPKVHWHGWQWHPQELINQSDLFFLSSSDDPCPLAALEALQQGKPAVVYRGTGIAEIIDGIRGCAVFENYDVESAYRALSRAVKEPLNETMLAERFKETVSLDAFSRAIDEICRMA